LFEALIVPHRSLSGARWRQPLCALAGMTWMVGAYFLYLGAWPIFAFCGLAGLGVLLLTYLNARAGRASELVMLTENQVRIVRTTPSGQRSEVAISSGWLNVRLEERSGRVPRLLLGVHAQQAEVGTALGEAEKRALASALRDALHRARNPSFGDG
jgi:uncharacterized membrane protein